jgi:ABC-type Mn2+/Zn2+ transport system permease subunit
MNLLPLNAHEWWTIAIGALCGAACAVPGCFLVLRRLSLVGDAVSHAVLPGIAIAFVLTGSRGVLPMLVGASLAGVCAVLFSRVLARIAKVADDAALGVVYSCMFALGVVVITRYASSVDLDPSCVLFGQLETVALERGVFDAPRAFWTLLIGGVITFVLLACVFKELKLAIFDEALAHAFGFKPKRLHALLMAIVAVVCVVSFEAVGSILVIAMLVAPPAAARLWTDRLIRMISLSVIFGVVSSPIGYIIAKLLDASVAGMTALIASCWLGVSVLIAPKSGLLPMAWTRFRLRKRIAREDVLGVLYRRSEGREADIVARGALSLFAHIGLKRRGWIMRQRGEWVLTPSGRAEAERIIRSHRLWETYLASRVGLPVDHVHAPSEVMEHYIDAELAAKLKAEVQVDHDAQGRPIP